MPLGAVPTSMYPIAVLIDTDAAPDLFIATYITQHCNSHIKRHDRPHVYKANIQSLSVMGTVLLLVCTGELCIRAQFLIAENLAL